VEDRREHRDADRKAGDERELVDGRIWGAHRQCAIVIASRARAPPLRARIPLRSLRGGPMRRSIRISFGFVLFFARFTFAQMTGSISWTLTLLETGFETLPQSRFMTPQGLGYPRRSWDRRRLRPRRRRSRGLPRSIPPVPSTGIRGRDSSAPTICCSCGRPAMARSSAFRLA
jgi:hypothetical protein